MSPGPRDREARHPAWGGKVFVELVRLAVVVLATGAAFSVGDELAGTGGLPAEAVGDEQTLRLVVTVLGASVGYVLGGVLGRFALGRIDAAERQIARVSSGELVTGMIGGVAGMAMAAGLLWPILLFPGRLFTVPLAALVAVVLVTAGVRVGASRGGDLLRFVGASGRLGVSAPARGATAKVIDSSALVDGRLVEVCRAGFCEGPLVVPQFVLYELQALADAPDDDRRERGRRGLDTLGALQRSAGVALEVVDRGDPGPAGVEARLVAMAREQQAALLTVDGNLARVAEVQGVRVLNLNALAETLRPPVLPGDVLAVRIVKAGKEEGQGVGYLADGTMVVVEGARDHQGSEVACEVTSLLSNQHGRMVFASARDVERLRARAIG